MSIRNKTFTISIPTDQGFLGQICPSKECGKYFKIHDDHFGKIIYCPYCGSELKDADLFTPEQQKYFETKAKDIAVDYMIDEIDKMFSSAFRGSKYIKYTKSPKKRTHSAPRTIKEQKVDSEISCPDCGTKFQVFGIFGYCPICRSENIMIYEANLGIIKSRIQSVEDQQRELRYAYNDLVSTFEYSCKRISKKHGLSTDVNFQNLADTRKHFKNSPLSIDFNNSISDAEYLILRRVFEKKHVNQHNRGIINDKYVRLIPQDRKLLGQKAILSLEEFEDAVKILRKVIGSLILP